MFTQSPSCPEYHRLCPVFCRLLQGSSLDGEELSKLIQVTVPLWTQLIKRVVPIEMLTAPLSLPKQGLENNELLSKNPKPQTPNPKP